MKREAQFVIAVLYFFLSLAGCQWGNDQNPDELHNKQSDQEEERYGKVIVDNLRMRDIYGLGGQEITQIGRNQFVRLTGNQSDTTESIQIRGQSIPHYWYEVIFNGDTGWIYGGGMEILEASDPRSTTGGINDFRIEPGIRAGVVNKNSTHESLINQLGADAVIKDRLHIGEGEWVEGTIIYPNTKNELLIYWQNEDFKTIRQIIVSKPGSEWQTTSGIQIGQSIREVTRINGASFNLTGFQWDYAGKTLNWQGGALSSHLTLVFDYTGEIAIYPFLIGDKVISSDNSSLLKLDPRVRQIIVTITE